MGIVLRGLFAPTIISAYTIYGVVTTPKSVRARCNCDPSLSDYFAGASIGFAYGTYYVLTGHSLRDTMA